MKCPKCKTELIISGQERLQTLSEHVSNPNNEPSLKDKYICINTSCLCYNNVCWNDDGETYGGYRLFSKNELTSPYGSFQRKMEIEVYKKGLKRYTKLPAWLMLWFLKPVIEHEYNADEDGNVLSKFYKLSIWNSETSWKLFKKDSEFNIGAIWWIRTWKYLWRKYKENGKLEKSLNREFPYKAFEWFVEIIEKIKILWT